MDGQPAASPRASSRSLTVALSLSFLVRRSFSEGGSFSLSSPPEPPQRNQNPPSLPPVAPFVANAALLAAVLVGTDQSAPAEPTASGLESAVPPAVDSAFDSVASLWTRLDHDDPAEHAARLRTAGFDEATVRALVWERMRPPAPAESAEVRDAPYWRRSAILLEVGERQAAARKAGRTSPEVAAFTAIFGEKPSDPRFEPDGLSVRNAMRRTPAQVAQVVQELHRIRREDIPQSRGKRYVNGQPDAATVAKLNQREQAQVSFEAGLRDRLSDEEYAAYLLYESPAAHFLRHNVNGLNLTQAEFDTVVVHMADSRSFRRDLPNHAAELTTALGEQRYAELVQAATGNERANFIIERLGLPFSAAMTLQAIQDDVSARSSAIGRDRSLSRDERLPHLAALAVETRERIAAVLPPEGVELYLTHAAEWMNTLRAAEARLEPGP